MSKRLASLDAFRGFTIASMVLVNNPGDWSHIHGPLEHAKWNGWTFTDWIFPFFLFIGGISMTLSLGRRAEEGADKAMLLKQLGKRAAIIFGIGLLLNLIPHFSLTTVRIPGVLQRIALCTMLAAPFVVYLDWRRQCLVILGAFTIYAVLMLAVPVPDADGQVGAGVLEPGRDFGAWLDRLVLGRHMWSSSKTWDPEGLTSTLPALGSQLFGVLTGRWLAQNRPPAVKTLAMFVAGGVCLALGAVLDVIFMPINKSLWTPTYAITMTGFGLVVFAAFYWTMDAAPYESVRKWAARVFVPFTIYGMNALFIFMLSGLIGKMLVFIKLGAPPLALKTVIYAPIKALPLSLENTSLIFAILFNLFMFAVGFGMWKKKWFVKV
jgi:predicted acyltransferase